MSSDGSSEFIAWIYITALISLVLFVAFVVATWLHHRSEARKDAACEGAGGVRIEADNRDYCVRKSALLGIDR